MTGWIEWFSCASPLVASTGKVILTLDYLCLHFACVIKRKTAVSKKYLTLNIMRKTDLTCGKGLSFIQLGLVVATGQVIEFVCVVLL